MNVSVDHVKVTGCSDWRNLPVRRKVSSTWPHLDATCSGYLTNPNSSLRGVHRRAVWGVHFPGADMANKELVQVMRRRRNLSAVAAGVAILVSGYAIDRTIDGELQVIWALVITQLMQLPILTAIGTWCLVPLFQLTHDDARTTRKRQADFANEIVQKQEEFEERLEDKLDRALLEQTQRSMRRGN